MVKDIITNITEGNYAEAQKLFNEEVTSRLSGLVENRRQSIFDEISESEEEEDEDDLDEAARRPRPPKIKGPDTLRQDMDRSRAEARQKRAEKRKENAAAKHAKTMKYVGGQN